MEGEIFLPEIHPHALNLKSSNKLYECRGCEVVGSDLRRLRCEQCDFDFHEECAHVKRTTTHDLFNNYNFKFFHQPPHPSSTKRCVVCRGFVPGFVYYCEELELCMHPRCHSLQSKFKFYHLEFMLRDVVSSSVCLWCKKRWYKDTNSWSYVSKCNKYKFHVPCAFGLIISQAYKGVPLGNNLDQSIQGFLEITVGVGDILKRQRRRKIVMSFVITNLVLELSSALLDQVSSSPVNKSRRALFGMLISFAAMLTCIVELIYEFRTEKLIWRWRGTLPFPWYYYLDQRRKSFGTFKDIVGLVCALCQCVVSTVSYYYLRRHIDSPIKISIFPIIFAFGILFSQILKNQDANKPPRENLLPV